MSKRVLVPLAEGFEEIEATTIIDVLRRGGVDVTTAGLTDSCVRGAHNICICADTTLDAALEAGTAYDAVVLPGGMPGASNLRDDERVKQALRDVVAAGGTAAAICAAPIALEAAGLLGGRNATAYPSFRDQLTSAAAVTDGPVVSDGPIVTSCGPGTALEFGLALVARFVDDDTAAQLRAGMLVG